MAQCNPASPPLKPGLPLPRYHADQEVGVTDRDGPAASSPDAALPGEPGTVPCRIGPHRNHQFLHLRLLSLLSAHRTAFPDQDFRAPRGINAGQIETCRSRPPAQRDPLPLPAYRNTQAPQTVASPCGLEAEDRKPERNHDECRSGRNDHHHARQHSPADDQHGYPALGLAGNLKDCRHSRFCRQRGQDVDPITASLRHRRIFLRYIVAYAQ